MIGRGAYQSIKSPKAALGSPTNFWEISWGGAEVEVDSDTGEIKLLKYVSSAGRSGLLWQSGFSAFPTRCR